MGGGGEAVDGQQQIMIKIGIKNTGDCCVQQQSPAIASYNLPVKCGKKCGKPRP